MSDFETFGPARDIVQDLREIYATRNKRFFGVIALFEVQSVWSDFNVHLIDFDFASWKDLFWKKDLIRMSASVC